MTTTENGYKSPTPEECMKALADYGTPEHVIGHCRAVNAVGYELGKALNEHRPEKLDLDLIRAAGLLHDMARVEDNHWDVAAEHCLCMGWKREAAIIKVHMSYEFNDFARFNETDIVCLADRIVLEDRYVGLDARMDYIIAKAIKNGNDNYVPIIERKKKDTMKLIREIEECLEVSLDDLLGGIDRELPHRK